MGQQIRIEIITFTPVITADADRLLNSQELTVAIGVLEVTVADRMKRFETGDPEFIGIAEMVAELPPKSDPEVEKQLGSVEM